MKEAGGNYREEDVPLAEVVVADDLLVIHADGSAGRQARDGQGHGGSRAGRGRQGRSGGDAAQPERGSDAGRIDVTLSCRAAGDDRVELVGHRIGADGRRVSVREQVAVGDMGYVRLSACGGRGGDGGCGGDGEDGGKGADGSDATRFSSGDDGDPGGDGGDGGRGTGGADGGRGGQVVVTVDAEDTHLLMLMRCQVLGGEGGSPGRHGQGGAGGPGGDGGSSYSWTTSSREDYTDSQGQHNHAPSRTITAIEAVRMVPRDGRGGLGKDPCCPVRTGRRAKYGWWCKRAVRRRRIGNAMKWRLPAIKWNCRTSLPSPPVPCG